MGPLSRTGPGVVLTSRDSSSLTDNELMTPAMLGKFPTNRTTGQVLPILRLVEAMEDRRTHLQAGAMSLHGSSILTAIVQAARRMAGPLMDQEVVHRAAPETASGEKANTFQDQQILAWRRSFLEAQMTLQKFNLASILPIMMISQLKLQGMKFLNPCSNLPTPLLTTIC